MCYVQSNSVTVLGAVVTEHMIPSLYFNCIYIPLNIYKSGEYGGKIPVRKINRYTVNRCIVYDYSGDRIAKMYVLYCEVSAME